MSDRPFHLHERQEDGIGGYLHELLTESNQIRILNLGNPKVTDVYFGQVTSNCNGLHLKSNLPNPDYMYHKSISVGTSG